MIKDQKVQRKRVKESKQSSFEWTPEMVRNRMMGLGRRTFGVVQEEMGGPRGSG